MIKYDALCNYNSFFPFLESTFASLATLLMLNATPAIPTAHIPYAIPGPLTKYTEVASNGPRARPSCPLRTKNAVSTMR